MSSCSGLEFIQSSDEGSHDRSSIGTFEKRRNFINGRIVYKNKTGEEYLYFNDGMWQVFLYQQK